MLPHLPLVDPLAALRCASYMPIRRVSRMLLSSSCGPTAAASDDTPWYPQRNVKRGLTRGVDKLSRKELRDIDYVACDAGMRNPATVLGRWPSLVAAMAPVRAALEKSISRDTELQDLPLAVGKSPIKKPPSQ